MSVDPVLPLMAAAFSAGLLHLSAFAKLREPVRFRAALQAQALLPQGATAFVARLIAPIELVCAALAAGAFLAYEYSPPVRVLAFVGCGGLYLAFALALTINLLRGRRDLDCGCFLSAGRGAAPAGLSYWQAARNLALVLSLTLLGFAPSRETQPLDYVTAGGAAALLALLIAARRELQNARGRAEVRT